MRNFGPLLFFSFLLSVAITLACGTPRVLESVAVSPATADAQDFPSGQVPFVATGYYSKVPTTVSPDTATWSACYQGQFTNGVTISSTGVAQCSAGGASGTYFIFADVPNPGFRGTCPLVPAICGTGICGSVIGTALLTCP
jgi:hypothetical protein